MINRKKEFIFLFAVFLVAFALRIGFAVKQQITFNNAFINDVTEYNEFAVSVLSGKGFSWIRNGAYSWLDIRQGQPTSFRPPAYPYFLSGIYLLFGFNILAVKIAESICGAFVCVIMFYIGRALFNRQVGVISSLISVFYPSFIRSLYYRGPGFFFAEYFFLFVLSVAVYFLVRVLKTPSFSNIFFCSLFFAIASLTRAEALFVPAFSILVFTVVFKDNFLKRGIKSFIAINLLLALMLLPWTVRNYVVHKAFVPVSTLGGLNFCEGNSPLSKGAYGMAYGFSNPIEFAKEFHGLSEVEWQKKMFKKGLEYFRLYPKIMLKLFFRKPLSIWCLWDFRYNIAYAVIFFFACLGAIISFCKNSPIPKEGTVLFLSFFIYQTLLILVLGAADPRCRYPYEPYLILLASTCLYALFTYYSKINRILPWLTTFIIVIPNFLIYLYSDKVLTELRKIFEALHLR